MIVGAGLAGLIVAHAFPTLPVVEAMPEPREMHKAVLRFRNNSVSSLTGIDFEEVTVQKGIFCDGEWRSPTIDVCNAYSQKVLNKIISRSIIDIAPVKRYIAPEDFYQQMLDRIGSRIQWGTLCDFSDDGPKINTAPLPVVWAALRGKDDALPDLFKFAPISVMRFRIQDCHAFQTVYFPTQRHSMYRASITGDLLICEFAAGEAQVEAQQALWMRDLSQAFALCGPQAVDVSADLQSPTTQKFGKIAPIDEELRRQMVSALTRDHNIFSIGRFATWRNILLDDVVKDIAVVKRLLTASHYERMLALS